MELILIPLGAALWLTALILRAPNDDTLWSFLESLHAGLLWLALFFFIQWQAALRDFQLGEEHSIVWLLLTVSSAGCVGATVKKLIRLKRTRRRVGRTR